MYWLKEKLFGKKKTKEEDLAQKLYDVLVLDGGPSGNAPNRIDAVALKIPLGKMESFAQKRLISLEALLFVAAQIETSERTKKLQEVFGDGAIHPFAAAMGNLITQKWQERGIEIDAFDVGERCFDEVEEFLQHPFRWGRAWLDEIYNDPEKSGENYIVWTEQWLKEFKAMRNMVAQFS